MGLMETATKAKKFNLDPRLILVDARKDSITLSWPHVDKATRYILDIRQVADGENPNKDHEAEFDRISESIKSTQIRKRNLEPETEYFFRVAPVVFDKKKNKNKRGEWITHKEPFTTLSESQEDDFSMLPPIVTVPVESNSLMITWEEVQEEIYGFELQMREHKGGARWFGSQQLATEDGGIKNEVQRFNLTSKHGYQFRVRPVTDYDEPFSPPSDPVVPRIGQNNAQYYPRTPFKPPPKEEEEQEEEDEEEYEYDDYEEDDNTWYYSQEGNYNEEEYDDDYDEEEEEEGEEEDYYADEYARKSAPAPRSATFQSRRRKKKDEEDAANNKCPPPWFKSADTPGSILICWEKQEGSTGYELQMKELHYELQNKKMEDYSGDWKTIASCLQGTQVKKKNLTSPFGYQFRVKPVDGQKSDYFSEPSNPVILPGASSTQRTNTGGGRQDRTKPRSSMPAPWFKAVPGGEKHAIIVCWQPQTDVTGYELQMRDAGGGSNDDNQAWTTIANNLKGTQVKKKNLTNPNGYQFRVRPVDGPSQHKGYSPPSSTAIAK